MTNQKLIDYLTPYGQVQQIAPDQILHLGSGQVLLAGGAYLHQSGELNQNQYLYVLQTGRLMVSHQRPQGGTYLKYLVAPGHFFGEQILTGIPTIHFFAYPLTPVTYLRLKLEHILQLMEQDEAVDQQMLSNVARRVRQLKHKVEQLAYHDSRSRVVDFLWEMATDFGEKQEKSWIVDNFLKNKEIAQLTFTSRQTVNSVMNDLKKRGLIDFNPKQIKIRPELMEDSISSL